MSWSDRDGDPLPPNHPDRKGKAMNLGNIRWGTLIVGVIIGWVAAAYGPKFINR